MAIHLEVKSCSRCPFRHYNGGPEVCTHPFVPPDHRDDDVGLGVDDVGEGDAPAWCPLALFSIEVRRAEP